MINNTNWVDVAGDLIDCTDIKGQRGQVDYKVLTMFNTLDLFDNLKAYGVINEGEMRSHEMA